MNDEEKSIAYLHHKFWEYLFDTPYFQIVDYMLYFWKIICFGGIYGTEVIYRIAPAICYN